MKEFIKALGTKQQLSTVYYPQTDSQIETNKLRDRNILMTLYQLPTG